jgi:hypothetical protein
MMQTQTQVPPALQVLMSMGAQPTAPGPMGQPIPTIASQKVEQQAQGLEALMPGVRQQAMQSAQAAQPVTQAQLQQVMQQQSPGISGLPAQNMRFAEGGVIGYAGPDGSDVELDVSGRIKKALRDWYERTERGYMERAGATPEQIAQKLGQAAPAPAEPPQASYSNEERIGLASKPVPIAEPTARPTGIAASRVEAPVRTASVRTAAPMAETGIATALPATPTLDKSGIATAGDAIAKAAAEREARMRGILAERERTASGMADLNAEGIAALQEANRARQELLAKQRGDDKFNRQMALLRGFQGDRAAYDRAVAGQQARDEAANQAQLMHQQAVLKLREAQQAKQLGQFDRALAFEQQAADLEGKARASSLEAQRIAASLATSEYSGLVNLREQNIRMQEGEANRANAIELERMRRATADRPGETERIFNRFNELKAKDPAAAEQYLQSIERIKGLGRGVEEKAEFARLRQQATMLQNELKAAMETDPLGKSPRIADLRAKLDGIYKQLGGESAPAAGRTMTIADVQATAKASGKTVDEVKKAATAAGYTVQ